ncbi:MAG: GNAT family N-acetyltransferase [Prevotella sp.]|nr:GNAT family N-acetyltransferase [Prevotella sp.]
MNKLTTTIYRKLEDLPQLDDTNFFHSSRLFQICKEAPRQKPYMVVVTDEKGRVVSHLLSVVRYRTFIFPPFLLIHCRVLGEGVYYHDEEYARDQLFGEMLEALTRLLNKRTLYIEVSNLSQKMTGYRQLKQQQYYPVHWMSIHNSLHSHAPEERITEKLQKRIDNARAKGVTTNVVTEEEDFTAFSKLLRKHNLLKPKRYIPDDLFFRRIMEGNDGQLFVTKYHNRVIGCSAVVYSEGNAYLWYSAFRRKSYMAVHPDVMTIWDAMQDCYKRGFDHMCFMDVGLPFSKNPFREFILRFGGKEQSTYRWFRFSIRWVNKLLRWLYRE